MLISIAVRHSGLWASRPIHAKNYHQKNQGKIQAQKNRLSAVRVNRVRSGAGHDQHTNYANCVEKQEHAKNQHHFVPLKATEKEKWLRIKSGTKSSNVSCDTSCSYPAKVKKIFI